MKIAIGIKALNEAGKIEAALRSALAAVAPYGGTVLLADSGSTDATVEIARRLPVDVVQLANRAERSCGAGAQLAFQHLDAEYFCLIDGDMELVPGFIEASLAYLDAHPQVAGVGGQVIERNLEAEEFQIRAAAMANEAHRRAGPVDRLDGGGVYRMRAIREVGYFSDRNLHSFEEFDLAARLISRGWTLVRIDVPAVEHRGHSGNGYRLLLYRLTSGQMGGAGEVLRASLGKPHFPLVVRRLGHLRKAVVIAAWWLALILALWRAPLAAAALVIVPVAWLGWRRGSLALGLYSFAMWNALAIGLIGGLFRRRVPPTRPLASVAFTRLPPAG
ncbi:glycosyltransferase [Sphingomonas sp. H39-1-10]|uniref:glycosyltransferase family 2 protein n=1 Tax=Sphingomonas pollutisoli TaxID=3030829 RepID=UPI0023B9AD95|nr:glycosyltransferase [Sphingomonas pollutisoli]MDF0490646.1 glycosyltransferase [Sphingomonas pollutisoli]